MPSLMNVFEVPVKSAYMVGGQRVEVDSLLETLLGQTPLVVNLLFGTIVSEFIRELFFTGVKYR